MKNFFDFIQNNHEFIIASAAIVVVFFTFISIIITVISVWMQRKQNRQSVRPIGNIICADYENYLAVKIRNLGLGPLIIDRLQVLKSGVVMGDDLISCMPDPPNNIKWSDFTGNLPGISLSPGEEKMLVELTGDDRGSLFERFRTDVRKSLGELTIKLIYKDVYGSKMEASERSLDWFLRHQH